MKYCIGVLVRSNSALQKTIKMFDELNLLMDGKDQEMAESGETWFNWYALKGTDIPVECHVLVNATVPQAIKDKVQGSGRNTLNASKIMWVGLQDMTEQEMRQRLIQWIGEDGCDHYWIVDENSDVTFTTTDNLVARFTAL